MSSIFQQAVALGKQGKHQQAINLLEEQRHSFTNNAQYFCELGLQYYFIGQQLKAIPCYEKALALDPNYNSALVNVGVCYNETNQNDKAVACYEKSFALNPANKTLWGNLAKALHDGGEHEKSIYCYHRALEHKRNPQNLRGLALAYRKTGRNHRSQELLEEALRQDPNDFRAHFGVAMNSLALGDYEKGTKALEWRFHLPNHQQFRQDSPGIFKKPCYNGEDLSGKTVLLYTEQGFGDTLQFCRFIPLLCQRAKKVVMWSRSGLGALLAQNFDIEVSEDDSIDAGFDYNLSVMSLPFWFDPALESLKNSSTYLFANPNKAAIVTPAPKKLNVGLVWGAEQRGLEYGDKKVPLELLAPLFEFDDIEWHSLQVGDDKTDLEQFSHKGKLHLYDQQLKDFADTATAIEPLDLVISVDTSVAHLAGAMGKPTWMFCKHFADWRWHVQGTKSEWYPSLTLYRQMTVGSWQEVVNDIATDLAELRNNFVAKQQA